MLKIIKIRCKRCKYPMQVVHQIVPPESFENGHPTLATMVLGCKNKEQKFVCEKCKSNEFEQEGNLNS